MARNANRYIQQTSRQADVTNIKEQIHTQASKYDKQHGTDRQRFANMLYKGQVDMTNSMEETDRGR